jgi:hypothetical protein
MGEVRVQRDGAVALRAIRALEREAQQLLETARVALAHGVRHDRHRQHLRVGGEHRARLVGRGVVRHQQVVLPWERGEHLAHLPEHQPRGAGFVVDRHADIDHGSANLDERAI